MKNSPLKLKRPTHPRETGIALVTVLVMIVLMATLVSITSILAIGNRKSGTDTVLGTKAQYAAEAGLENAMYQIYYKTKENWAKSADNNVNTKFDACMFRKWLTGRWQVPGTTTLTPEQLTANGNKDCPYGTATATVTDTTLETAPTFPTLFNGEIINDSSLLNKVIEGTATNGTRYQVSVSRKEDTTSGETILSMTSTGIITQSGKDVAFRKLSQVAKISSRAYDGDRFAMLTNATNCSFCHLHIDTMQRAYASQTSAELYNRARVAVLTDNVKLGDQYHKQDTFIAGTLYIRNGIEDPGGKWTSDHVYGARWAKEGTTVKPGFVKAGPVQSNTADGTTGIIANYLGSTNTDAAIDAAVVDASVAPGTKTKFAKIYTKYPRENDLKDPKYAGEWPDGPVPDDFPAVVAESSASKDGLISDTEWTDYLKTAPSGKIIAEANTKIFGVRRQSSTSTNAKASATPISYDPTSSEVNDTLYLSTPQNLTAAVLTTDLATLKANQRAGQSINWFITKWKGWLVQQALATPNNRDLEPGVGQDSNVIDNPINGTPVSGLSKNNFWLKYNPSTAQITLSYRDYPSGTNTTSSTTSSTTPPTSSATKCVDAGINCTIPVTTVSGNVETQVTKVDAQYVDSKGSSSWKTVTSNFTCSKTFFSYTKTGGTGGRCDIKVSTKILTTTSVVTATPGARSDYSITFGLTETDLFPQKSNKAKEDLEKNGQWDGNLIIDAGRIGDKEQERALTVNGTIYVNGDLAIRGQIKGRGRIIARGNIYVVGDFVYGCGDHACKIIESGSGPSYRNSRDLPLIGLLAGGNVIVGDYDFPDYRATSSTTGAYGGGIYDLVNDQVGRTASALPSSKWPYYSVPGATGANTGGSGGDMGFVPMIAANANYKNRDSSGSYITTSAKRYFQFMPFGPILGRSGFGSYAGQYVDTVGSATVIPIYPSNGPIRIGDSTNNGMVTAAGAGQIGIGISCSSPDTLVAAKRFGGGTATFNYGFYCPPTAGKFLRNSSTPNDNNNPGTNAAVWTAQSAQNTTLDGDVGMTTGWLAGLLGRPTGGAFTQIGDLSQSRLIKLMWLTTMDVNRDMDPHTEGYQAGPLRTDGIFYSAHGIFALARSFKDTWTNATTATAALGQRSTTEGRWIHNGSGCSRAWIFDHW
jgi:Tfp pilus assembly protein PilX